MENNYHSLPQLPASKSEGNFGASGPAGSGVAVATTDSVAKNSLASQA